MRNHSRHLSVPRAIALVFGSILLTQSVPLALGATNTADTVSTNAAAGAPAVEIPKSVFVIPTTVAQGRDPFFPLSRHWMAKATSTNTTAVKAPPVTLTLKGIGGTDAKRYVLINDKTFLAGEEGEISMGASRVRVRCLEVRDSSAVVEVDGNRQELRLRPGL